MKTNQSRRSPRKWTVVALIALTIFVVSFALFNESATLKAQAQQSTARKLNQGVFTPAHANAGLAVRHFFGIRPEAVQPVAYQHKPHLAKGGPELMCVFCHESVETGPVASIPGVSKCM